MTGIMVPMPSKVVPNLPTGQVRKVKVNSCCNLLFAISHPVKTIIISKSLLTRQAFIPLNTTPVLCFASTPLDIVGGFAKDAFCLHFHSVLGI